MKSINQLVSEIWGSRIKGIEKALITAIEVIEGRVPSNEEVKKYGWRMIYPDGSEEYLWKDIVIVKVPPVKFPLC